MTVERPIQPRTELGFAAKLLLVTLFVALVLALWTVVFVFILSFGGIIVAVALNNLASPLSKHFGLPHQLALVMVAVGLLLIAIASLAAFGTQAAMQFRQLVDQLPEAWMDARTWLDSGPAGQWLLGLIDSAQPGASALLSAVPVATNLFSFVANAALILVIGIYLAADPSTYRDGALRLVPVNARARARRIMDATGSDLRKWLIAMTLDMVFLGTVTGMGLWIVGAPFPFPLGVLSGLSVFVPYIGPIVATVPGLLLALSVSPENALYAGIIYLIAQQLEGNISLPLLQRWTVQMPPVVSLLAIVAFGLLFGLWGVLLATPMAVVTMTIVRMGYVEAFLEREAG